MPSRATPNAMMEFIGVMEYGKTPVTSALQLSPGDHLRINRQGIYDHHMLVVEAYSANSLRVIHYTSLFERGPGQEPYPPALSNLGVARNENGERAPLGVVAEETLTVTEEDLRSMHLLRYPEGVRVFSVEESISRARSRLNEKEYNLITNNCECFVNWAVTGEAISYQIVSGTMAALKGAAKHAREAYDKGGTLFGMVGNGLLGAVAGYLEHRNAEKKT